MPTALDPFRFLRIALAGWMNERQLQMIEYLREETVSFANNLVMDVCGSLITSAGVLPPKPEDLGERCWPSSPQSSRWRHCCAGTDS
jgi:hypothetical protein